MPRVQRTGWEFWDHHQPVFSSQIRLPSMPTSTAPDWHIYALYGRVCLPYQCQSQDAEILRQLSQAICNHRMQQDQLYCSTHQVSNCWSQVTTFIEHHLNQLLPSELTPRVKCCKVIFPHALLILVYHIQPTPSQQHPCHCHNSVEFGIRVSSTFLRYSRTPHHSDHSYIIRKHKNMIWGT